jgi:pyrroloquinoline quinone (PQQ) biosynthesis protein C
MSFADTKIGPYNDAALNRIRNHRFIQAAHRGDLTEGQVCRWIFLAGRESKSFPQILENMLVHTTDERVRQILSENLDDEYGNGNPEHAHFKHYLHLLDKMGLGKAPFDEYEELAGIRLALDLAHWVSKQPDLPVAIGYMLVNEGMTSITYGAVDVALHKYHPNLVTDFFRLHVEVDAHHLEQLMSAADCLGPSALDAILSGIDLGERGMAVLLDEAYGAFRLAA